MLRSLEVAANRRGVSGFLSERYGSPTAGVDFIISGSLSSDSGYFRLGPETICYGRCSSRCPAPRVTNSLYDVYGEVTIHGSSIHLPFDPDEIVDNLLTERYEAKSETQTILSNRRLKSLYYLLRPYLGTSARKYLQRLYFLGWKKIPFPQWPVDHTVENLGDQMLLFSMQARRTTKLPFIWFWPDGAKSCTIVTHDVETAAGWRSCPELMDLDQFYGIRASFQVIPEGRYRVDAAGLEGITNRGFEVNIHDLNHDGLLFSDRQLFLRRAEQINSYGRQFGAAGFRSAVLYRNTDWYDALEFSYDMSIPNVAHLDPQRGGCCTVFPFFIGSIVELPLTTTQDYSLFSILNDYSIRLWEQQIALIRERHGLISVNVHPDCVIDRAARCTYIELLHHLAALQRDRQTWTALPNEVATWWRLRSRMHLVSTDTGWRIEGEGGEKARLAYAVIADRRLVYEIDQNQQ
jgi:hypothetical protein